MRGREETLHSLEFYQGTGQQGVASRKALFIRGRNTPA